MRIFLPALARVIAALSAGALSCGAYVATAGAADTGNVVTWGLLCTGIEFLALGVGTYVAARHVPSASFEAVLLAGITGFSLLGLVLIAFTGSASGSVEVVAVSLPIAAAVAAMATALGRRSAR